MSVNKEVSVEDMLEARDQRALQQKKMLEKYQAPLLCVTMNIPGPIKLLPKAEDAFVLACERVGSALRELGAEVLCRKEKRAKTGCEAMYALRVDAQALKKKMIAIEEFDAFGRLLDLDVLLPTGEKLVRFVPRKCLLCGREVGLCARSRAHSVSELTKRVTEILEEFVR